MAADAADAADAAAPGSVLALLQAINDAAIEYFALFETRNKETMEHPMRRTISVATYISRPGGKRLFSKLAFLYAGKDSYNNREKAFEFNPKMCAAGVEFFNELFSWEVFRFTGPDGRSFDVRKKRTPSDYYDDNQEQFVKYSFDQLYCVYNFCVPFCEEISRLFVQLRNHPDASCVKMLLYAFDVYKDMHFKMHTRGSAWWDTTVQSGLKEFMRGYAREHGLRWFFTISPGMGYNDNKFNDVTCFTLPQPPRFGRIIEVNPDAVPPAYEDSVAEAGGGGASSSS